MSNHVLEILASTWTDGVASDYYKGLVVSESSLMSVWYYHLRSALKESPYRVFTEPALYLRQEGDERHTRYRPDIVIGREDAEGRCAAAVVEIKWVPFHYPDYLGDLNKLVNLDKAGDGSYSAAVCPKKGEEYPFPRERRQHFAIDANTRFIFAVVGKEGSEALDTDKIRECIERDRGNRKRFSHFSAGAFTAGNEYPKFMVRSEL
jgi:hypothetical protein